MADRWWLIDMTNLMIVIPYFAWLAFEFIHQSQLLIRYCSINRFILICDKIIESLNLTFAIDEAVKKRFLVRSVSQIVFNIMLPLSPNKNEILFLSEKFSPKFLLTLIEIEG